MISLDRSTMSMVLRSLSERRMVREQPDPAAKRKKRLQLTGAWRLILAAAERLSASSNEQMLNVPLEDKAQQLLALLELFPVSASPDEQA